MNKRIALITDNIILFESFCNIIEDEKYHSFSFNFYYSFFNDKIKEDKLKPINVKKDCAFLIANFDLVISLHCKQMFPPALVNNVKCINVHPGFNPYNRGWYPQVFSIINGFPIGATIHEIDEKLDHGDIIDQEIEEILEHDTSYTLYQKIIKLEEKLLRKNLFNIIQNSYSSKSPQGEGNLNLKSDFNKLCKLDLENINSLKKHFNLLRALTHGHYKNAYFINSEGKRVFVSIEFEIED